MTQEWITDRPPTAADGDMDEEVRMRRRPCSSEDEYNFAHWSHIGPGCPWQHTEYWQPTAEPTTAEPERIAALEQRVAELEIRVLEQMGMMAAHLSRSAAEAFESLRADR
jgi:hypothetical protein